jgi:hypothetical protein
MNTELQRELKEITLHARQLLIANGNSEKNLNIAITALTKILETQCLKDAIQLSKGALLQIDNENYLAAYSRAQIKANPRVAAKEAKKIVIEKPKEKEKPPPKPVIETPKKSETKKKNGQKWTRGHDGKIRRTDGALF